MDISQTIMAVDSHTMGEPARIIVRGPAGIRGASLAQKRDYLREHMDELRRSVVNEPRGHSGMFAALLTEPCSPEADVGLIYMDNQGYVNMCVHATLAATVVLLETGMVRVDRQRPTLAIETPAGLVRVEAELEGGKVQKVHLRSVPAVNILRDAPLELRGRKLSIDVSYGGNTFAIVAASQLGIPVRQTHVDELVDWGMEIRDQANRQLQVAHPANPEIRGVHQVVIYGEPTRPEAHAKNVIVSGLGKVDRSPCGTGTCARLASLYARGEFAPGRTFINEGIIGTTFACDIVEEVDVGGLPGIVPCIRGNAYITGFNTLLFDERDPLKHGFMLKQF